MDLEKIQYDQWSFSGPCKVGLVSHLHEDHDPTLLESIWTPDKLYVPEFFTGRVADPTAVDIRAVREREGRRIARKCRAWPLGRRGVGVILGREVDEPRHAAWWLIRAARVALFVGELDVPEIPVLREVIGKINPDVLMLPVYGDLEGGRHRSAHPGELRERIDEFAEGWRGEIWALPHMPVKQPRWAARMAQKLPKRREE